MTVTVVANPLSTPPANTITMSVTTGHVMTNPVLSRIVDGVASPVRTQPVAGFDTRTVVDYEMPYDVPVTYEFVTDHINPVGSTVWDETWPNLTNWATVDSTWSVSAGKAIFNPAGVTGAHSISRSITPGRYRVTVSSLAQTGAVTGGYSTSALNIGSLVSIFVTSWGALRILDGNTGRATITTITASSPITVDLLDSSVFISGLGGTWVSSQQATPIYFVSVTASSSTGSDTFTVGEVKVTDYPTPTHVDELSSPVALSPAAAWLIHPSNPGLSQPVSSHDRSALAVRSIGDATNPATVTEHTILGQAYPITTTSGPRLGSRFPLTLMARTAVQERALMGMLSDGTPLLFRAPAAFPVGIDEGFYSVGDVSRTRLAQRPGDENRFVTLPLTRVQSPVVTVQNTGWSWAALAAEFATWADVAAAYDTWADVLTNNRKPGY